MSGSKPRSTFSEEEGKNSDEHTHGIGSGYLRVFSRFADKTSMTGVTYIYNARLKWAKVVWSILLVAALVAMGLHLWFLIDQYRQYPVSTKVSLSFANLQFPSVAICNANIIHKGRLDKIKGYNKLKKLIWEMTPQNLVPEQFNSNYNPAAANTTSGNIYQNVNQTSIDPDYKNYDDSVTFQTNEYSKPKSTWTQLEELFTELYLDMKNVDRKSLGHDIKDMLISCTYNGRTCDASFFRLYQTPQYGNCWVLDNPNLYVQTAGPSGGLQLVLYLESTEYLYGLTTGYGARIQIYEPKAVPYPYDEGMFVPANTETSISLKMLHIQRQSDPYGTCDNGAAFQTKYQRTYTRRACQKLCELEHLIDQCGCFINSGEEVSIARGNGSKLCRTDKEKRCSSSVKKTIERKTIACDCSEPCEEVEYSFNVNHRQWPNDWYAMVLLQEVCNKNKVVCQSLRQDFTGAAEIKGTKEIMNNFLKLNIYYGDLNFQELREEPDIEDQQFLSDVGGAIGLWIGLSLLSIFELVQLTTELINYCIRRPDKRRRRKQKRRRVQYGPNADRMSDSGGRYYESDPGERVVPYQTDRPDPYDSVQSVYSKPSRY